ncbi:6866_t:CDS:2 [Paraglomus brasilianum]|uniref:6866_t:CDS:1 n=1 Tax=Paraglomus brasilianum TaxID=144538 RepID=A0A9N8VYA8_9GLOM|nr:6866_t:CDS:2 [Paraglomus brasilianum]
MTARYLETLSRDLTKLYEVRDTADVIIEIENSSAKKAYKAHGIILSVRSEYFRSKLQDNEANNGEQTIRLDDFDEGDFEVLLKYIYTGILPPLADTSPTKLLELLLSSQTLCLLDLCSYFQERLVTDHDEWIRDNFISTQQLAFTNSDFAILQNRCISLIIETPKTFLSADDFPHLSKIALVRLLQRDDLSLSEVRIWDYTFRWCISQTSLSSDVSTWTKEDYDVLKSILEDFIPCIRFFHISSTEFANRRGLFEKLLPNKLYKEILQYHTNPEQENDEKVLQRRRGSGNQKRQENNHRQKAIVNADSVVNTDSSTITNCLSTLASPPLDDTLLTPSLSAWISGCIDHWTFPSSSLSQTYKFSLLLRGSREDFSTDVFHSLCDNKGPTVVILQVSETGELVGGYNPIDWLSPSVMTYAKTQEAFLFSLQRDNVKNAVLSRVKAENTAICYNSARGPVFGSNNAPDLMMQSNQYPKRWFCNQGSYSLPIRGECGAFSVDEYEVYRVFKG